MTRARNVRPKWCCRSLPRPYRGMSGRRLFSHMLGVFHDAGLREYFLFTDSTCDVGFYDHRGLIRKAERDDRNDGSSRPNPTDSSSSGLTQSARQAFGG